MLNAILITYISSCGLTTESGSTSVSETPIPTNDNMVNGGNEYSQEVLIGGAVIVSVFGITQILLIVAVVLLSVAIISVHKKYKKIIKEQADVQVKTSTAYGVCTEVPDLQLNSNSAYDRGMHEASSQVIYDYI